jgi:selenocysteine-specific elongation factor
VIVATAGHVDHGKTTLVKALTGVDADRLPEEKRRGMTIDLGFAYSGKLGFVDVPGHERFVHNMLAGVSGIDLALLVVAADDGPMPQTHEHLAIVRLLSVPRLAVALTKIDRVPRERVAEVQAQLAALLPDAPLFPVSSITGEGIAKLKIFLDNEARALAPRKASGNFRLSVDRCFSVAGAGLVVTGTALSGEVAVGDEVRALIAGTGARVRGIHAHNAPAQRGRAGQRLALNLAGLEGKAPVARGDWIVAGAVPEAVQRFDARLHGIDPSLRHWSAVHLHLGAADVPGRVAFLDGNRLAQLHLDRPVGAVRGDRFILRDASARRTLGGGTVIDVFPPARGRARPERLAWLAAMEIEDDEAALDALLERSPSGVDMARFAANRNLPAAAGRRFSAAHWRALRDQALAALAAWHTRFPDMAGAAEAHVAQTIRIPQESVSVLLDELTREGIVVREGAIVRLAAHEVEISPADAALWQRVEPILQCGGLRPPTLAELAAATGVDAKKLEAALSRLARHGNLVRVSKGRFFLPAAVRELEKIARGMGEITAAGFRDRSGIGRNLAIEVLEFFDRTKFTRRVGDAHVLLPESRRLG